MIKAADGKIGKREFVAIILFTIGIKLSDTTPNLLIDDGKNASWMIPLFSFVVVIIPFLVLLSLLKKHETGLIQLLHKLTGKFFGGFICMILFIIMFNSTFLNSRGYIDIVNTMFYQETPLTLLFFLLILVSFLIAKRGFETIGRTTWMILPLIGVIHVILIIFIWKDIHFIHLSPIAGPGFQKVIKASFTQSSIFTDIILLAAFYPFVRSYKDFRFASILGFAMACIHIATFIAIYIMVFDFPQVNNLAYLYQQLTRIAIFGEFISHVDAVFFGFWIISATIHFAIYLYLTAYLLAGSLQLTKFEPLILPIAGLALLLGLMLENISQVSRYRDMTLIINSGLLLFLPFFIYIMDRWKGRNKR